MIVKRYWHKGYGINRVNYMGIFLFGFIRFTNYKLYEKNIASVIYVLE